MNFSSFAQSLRQHFFKPFKKTGIIAFEDDFLEKAFIYAAFWKFFELVFRLS